MRVAGAAIGQSPNLVAHAYLKRREARSPGPLSMCRLGPGQLIFVMRSSVGGEMGLWAMKYRPRASTSTSPPS